MRDHSPSYEEPWKYNLLGLPPDVQVPADIDTDLYVIIGKQSSASWIGSARL